MKIFRLLLVTTFLTTSPFFAQVPFTHITNSTFNAERVASFGAIDAPNDFLEITNSTQFDNSFIPSIWGHQQSDNRYVLRLFATTSSSYDAGSLPLMMFRTEIRNNLNLNAPAGGSFPWGINGQNVVNRPLFGWENGNTRLMTMQANGFLGIGTETPTALLHTIGSVRFQGLANRTNPAFLLGTDSNGNVYEFPVSTGGGSIADYDWLKPDGTFPDNINDVIYTNGSIGINVENPTANLHLNGTVRLQNLPNEIEAVYMLGTDSNGNVAEYPVPENIGEIITDSDWLKIDNGIATSINDNIYTNGKVGINVNQFPTFVGDEDVSFYNLFVTGGILTEEVRISLKEDWADYVFKESYKLPTLQEVEEHIKKEGHLINIPSEDEVKKNGIEIGEMNKLLLEKIEELTLHVIDLNKKIEKQQNEINDLKKKNEK
ncbi:hypothetical protein KJK34_12365 [Flavobacterium sp. D11R37]|uniref:hypothetical protein n=1 Tax=Flavobacterium coralii TaxID=2838017 RepID=UPI001CA76F4E|nr:hypothetical protein [Flavobacterium coralii]MBY8963548.1 hypothetical protein [Flavobacterium coralii]